MSTHFVPSVRIAQLIPIEGADFIELAKVMDYQVIVKKGSFQVGDIALYLPEQTIVPEWALEMLGLVGMLSGPNKNILKIKKLRGCISQGLLLPVEKKQSNPLLNRYSISFPSGHVTIFPPEMTFENDYAEALGMKKVEVAVPKQLSGNVFNIGQGNTISYDIENFQHWPEVFDGKEVVVCEKIHGCADENTIINTLEHGDLTIKEIVDNEMLGIHVKSYDTNDNLVVYELLEAVSVLDNNNDWYELELENGQIVKLTGNHPVYIPSLKCYRRVRDLNGDEDILID